MSLQYATTDARKRAENVRSFVRMHSWRTPDVTKANIIVAVYVILILIPDFPSSIYLPSLLHFILTIFSSAMHEEFMATATTVGHRNRSLYARCRIQNTKSKPLHLYLASQLFIIGKILLLEKENGNSDSDIFFENLIFSYFYIYLRNYRKLLREVIVNSKN